MSKAHVTPLENDTKPESERYAVAVNHQGGVPTAHVMALENGDTKPESLIYSSAVTHKTEVSDEKAPEAVGSMFDMQPQFVNYGRVVLDLIMVILLVLVVISDIGTHAKRPGMSLNIHAMPIYKKIDIKLGDIWTKAMQDDTHTTDLMKVTAFQTDVAAKCNTIRKHPLCVCVAAAGSSMSINKNCMLKYPQPSVTVDWNIGTVSSAMILWFVASLATSVGTLSYIETRITRVPGTEQIIFSQYHTAILVSYVLLTLTAIFLPMITTAIQFSDTTAPYKYMDSLFNMLGWSLVAFASLAIFNWQTFVRYFHWSVHDEDDPKLETVQWERTSVNNFIVYVHLLFAAPAIAMVLHLTQQWTDYSTIVNTTLILSTIFAVDGFSSEMSNHWSREAQHDDTRKRENKPTLSPENIANLHMRLGLIRMFAWIINLIMLVLLFTLAYPIEVEQQKINSAIFVVIVVAYAAVFLAPDLVREFTDRISFNSINFRLYGDFVVRAMTLFFVWRASVAERSA